MVRSQNGGVSGQVVEVVHDDGHEEVEHDEGAEEDEGDEVDVGQRRAAVLARVHQVTWKIKSHVFKERYYTLILMAETQIMFFVLLY